MEQKVLESTEEEQINLCNTSNEQSKKKSETNFTNGMDEISKYTKYGIEIRKVTRSKNHKRLTDIKKLPKADTFEEENITTRVHGGGSMVFPRAGPKGPKIKLKFFQPLEKEKSLVTETQFLDTPGSSFLFPTKSDINLAEVSLSEYNSKEPSTVTMKKLLNTNGSSAFKKIANRYMTGESDFINNFRDSESIELSHKKKLEAVEVNNLGILKPSTRTIKVPYDKSKRSISTLKKNCTLGGGLTLGDRQETGKGDGIQKNVSFNRRVIVMEYHPKGRLIPCNQEKRKKKRKKTKMNLQKYFNL